MLTLYSKKRTEIKTGDLLAWKTTRIHSFFDFILFLYQKIIGAEYTHVGIAVNIGNRIFVLEATPPVVRLFPLSLSEDFHLFPLNVDVKPTHLDTLFKALGKKYSVFDLIRSTFNIGNSNNDYYCSELASSFYNSIGIIDNNDAGFTPDSLIEEITRTFSVQPVPVKIDRGNLYEL